MRERVLGRNEDGSFPLWKGIVAGMSAGAIGQFIANPTDLVKVQMQSEGARVAAGQPWRYNGMMHAFSVLAKENGVRGLWRGWIPSCQRAALVQLGDLTTYDSAKQFILRNTELEDNAVTHAMSSAVAGLVAAGMGTPADVIKTRVMADSEGKLYKGALDCLRQTVRSEGIPALWKGFFPIWCRMAPWSLTFFLTFEQLRRLSGLDSF
jgi:solute carrier family 25 uncoupling protein 27